MSLFMVLFLTHAIDAETKPVRAVWNVLRSDIWVPLDIQSGVIDACSFWTTESVAPITDVVTLT